MNTVITLIPNLIKKMNYYLIKPIKKLKKIIQLLILSFLENKLKYQFP